MDNDVDMHEEEMDWPPLFSAIKNEPHMAEIMIKEGADLNQIFEGWSPLQLATCERNLSVARLLLERGANPNHAEDVTALYMACLFDEFSNDDTSYEFCKLLLEYGADCHFRNFEGISPLHEALRQQTLKVINLIISYGADISMVDLQGNTALHCAACNHRVDVTAFVLDLGFDIEICNNDSATPLSCAIETENLEGCKFLIDRGAMVNRPVGRYSSILALVITRRCVNLEIVDLLFEYGAIVEAELLRTAATSGDGSVAVALM